MNNILRTVINADSSAAIPWVVCPFAGGSRGAFRSWEMLEDVSLRANLVTYPARDHRIADKPATTIAQLADELSQSILSDSTLYPEQYVLCGHSMGAQVAYETCLRLENAGKPPKVLVLSACHAPHLVSRRLLSHLSDEDFVAELVDIGGCSPELLKNPTLLDVFLPMLRADFIATENYKKSIAAASDMIKIPTLLVYGSHDMEASKEEVLSWTQWLNHDCLSIMAVDGDHFYMTEKPQYFLEQVGLHISHLLNSEATPHPALGNILHKTPSVLPDQLNYWANVYGNSVALIADDKTITYEQLAKDVAALAHGLRHLGLKPRQNAIVQLPNGVGFVTTCFALFAIGVVPVLTMPTQGERDIEGLSAIAEPAAYFIGPDTHTVNYLQRAKKLQKNYPQMEYIIVDDMTNDYQSPQMQTSIPTLTSLMGEEVGTTHDTVDLRSTDLALLLISGGTTGTPKLIPRTHGDYIFNFIESARLCEINKESIYLAVLPAAHNFTLSSPGILGVLSQGGTVVFTTYPSADEALPLIEKYRVTHTSLIPTLAQMWEQARDWETSDLSSLRCIQVGGAKLNPALAEKLWARLGPVQQVFGMAEGLLCYTRFNDDHDAIIRTQGRPLSVHDEVRIVNGDMTEVDDGQEGELLTRGPYTLRGYYKAQEYNKTAFTVDGFYRTGDLVRKTQSGNLQVVGRIKEQINRNGEKLAIVEIETLLQSSPKIQDAVIIGIPDDILGERVCAFIIPNNNNVLSIEDVRHFLTDKGLQPYKIPDQFEFVSQWPLTAVGKINKKHLIATVVDQKDTSSSSDKISSLHEL